MSKTMTMDAIAHDIRQETTARMPRDLNPYRDKDTGVFGRLSEMWIEMPTDFKGGANAAVAD